MAPTGVLWEPSVLPSPDAVVLEGGVDMVLLGAWGTGFDGVSAGIWIKGSYDDSRQCQVRKHRTQGGTEFDARVSETDRT